MRSIANGLTFATVLLATGVAGAGPAVTADALMSGLDPGVQVGEKLASVTPKGEIWLVWRQWRREWPDAPLFLAPDDGIYCRLVGRDGRDIVPVTRLFALERVPNDRRELGTSEYSLLPTVYYLATLVSGEAVLLINGTDRRKHLLVIDRRGSVRQSSIDVPLRIARDYFGVYTAYTGALVWRPNAWGSRLLVAGEESRWVEGSGNVYTYTLRALDLKLRKKTLTVVPGAVCTFPTVYYVDGTPHSDKPWLTGLDMSAEYTDVVGLKGDTLVVACVPMHNSTVDEFRLPPGRTIKVYWLRGRDWSLLDSVSIDRGDVAGRDYAGLFMPRAVLAPTASGYQFAVVTPAGVSTYRLDRRCRPVKGAREQSVPLGPDRYAGGGRELLFWLSKPRSEPPYHAACWYAFGTDGELYCEWVHAGTLRRFE